jgi:superoxide dismutase
MDYEDMYELMVEASRQAIRDEIHTGDCQISNRMLEGRITFTDGDGRQVKDMDTVSLFKKVTSVREKLRVLEQKVNNHPTLSPNEKAELQIYLTRSFGSLTTFNFMFQHDADKFRGSGS